MERGSWLHGEGRESQAVPNYSEQVCVCVCMLGYSTFELPPVWEVPPLYVSWKEADSHLPLEKQRDQSFLSLPYS